MSSRAFASAIAGVLLLGSALAAYISGWRPLSLPPNVIRWVVQSEEDNFGYAVYRGPSQEGPFERINARTIPGIGTTDLPQEYRFVDADIEEGTVYWYYVESIALDGERSRLTPVYASPARTVSLW